jgi:hypothetical protein
VPAIFLAARVTGAVVGKTYKVEMGHVNVLEYAMREKLYKLLFF